MDYRPDIDGLRAIAVLSVVLFHVGFSAFSGGYVGVDVFFVVSGYLITTLILGEMKAGTFSFSEFYFRRIRRIAPAFFFVILVVAATAWFIFFPKDFSDFGQSMFAALIFFANVHFAHSFGYFDRGAEFAPLLHTWSLSIEEQFYLFFPLLLLLAVKSGRGAAQLIVAFVALASFCFSLWIVSKGPAQSAFFSSFGRFWEILAGALLAGSGRDIAIPGKLRAPLSLTGLAMIVLPVFFYPKEIPFPGFAAGVPVLGTCLVIAAGAKGANPAKRFLSARPLVFIGTISYSLYLWHWPIVAISHHLMIYLNDRRKLIVIVVSILLAWLTWLFVERPARRLIYPRHGGRVFGLFFATGIAAAFLSTLVVMQDGMPGRFRNPALAQLISESRNLHPRWFECVVEPDKDAIDGWCPMPVGLDQARQDFFLWGDSNATALLPAIDLLSGENRRAGQIATMSACGPLVSVWTDNDYLECRNFNDRVLDYLKSAPRMSVILAARWSYYSEGSKAGGVALRVPVYLTDRPGKKGSREASRRLFTEGLERTVAALAGRHDIYIVKQVHIHRNSVPAGMAAEMRFGTRFERTTRAEYDRLVGFAHEAIDSLSERYGATVINPATILCREELCLSDLDGAPLFFDASHLSILGAKKLAPLLEIAFSQRVDPTP